MTRGLCAVNCTDIKCITTYHSSRLPRLLTGGGVTASRAPPTRAPSKTFPRSFAVEGNFPARKPLISRFFGKPAGKGRIWSPRSPGLRPRVSAGLDPTGARSRSAPFVIAGLDPAIQALPACDLPIAPRLDARVNPRIKSGDGHDARSLRRELHRYKMHYHISFFAPPAPLDRGGRHSKPRSPNARSLQNFSAKFCRRGKFSGPQAVDIAVFRETGGQGADLEPPIPGTQASRQRRARSHWRSITLRALRHSRPRT